MFMKEQHIGALLLNYLTYTGKVYGVAGGLNLDIT